jgi:Fur family ferric uptake transcriptional regulator/Fur family peroxide stress response transcriptional regulator
MNTDIENLGLTKQRKVVLQVIRTEEEHLTANEVFEKAKNLLPSISFATVYNSLRYLKKEEHIGEIQFGNGASRFDRMTTRHDHALCNNCGKIVDIQLELPEKLFETAAKYSNFTPESLEFTLHGLCSNCTKK